MERRVSRASGERSQEETKKLQQEILEVQEELDKKKDVFVNKYQILLDHV
jgi:hypothetical protein